MVTIFNYTDFRKYLRDRFAQVKAADPTFTYRRVASEAGFASPGLITQILQGSTNLSERLIPAITNVLSLKPREARYFTLMVRYNQADSHDDKKSFFEKMIVFKKGRAKTIDPQSYEFYDKWYYSAIRALLHYAPFTGDYCALARALVPSITPAEAKRAVTVLSRLGLIAEREGRFTLTEKHVTTGLNTDSVVINNFVINTLEIAKDALYRFDKEQRSFSALTLSVSESGYQAIKARTDAFRQELVDIVKNDREIDRVCQVNVQLFPLTIVSKGADA